MATQAIDFSDLGGRQVSPAPVGKIDFSDLGGTQVKAAPVQADLLAQQTQAAAQAAGGSTNPAPLPLSMQPAKETYDSSGKPTQIPQNIQDEIVRQGNRQAALGAAQARAMQSPTPFTNAAFGMDTPEGLAKIGEGLESGIVNYLPSTKIAAASQKFNELRGAIGEHTVSMTNQLSDALGAIKEPGAVASMPKVFSDFVARIADTDNVPLTYQEARNFYHNMSDLAASDKMSTNANTGRLVGAVKNALGDAISKTADAAGQLQKYTDAMSEFASGKQAQQVIEKAKDLAIKYGGEAAIGAGGLYATKKLWDLFGP